MDKSVNWQVWTVERMRAQGINVLWLKLRNGRWCAQVVDKVEKNGIKTHFMDLSRYLQCQ